MSTGAGTSCGSAQASASSGSTTCGTDARPLCSPGVPSRAIMEVLGHSGISVMVNTYAHVLPALRQEAADAIDELFGAS